ncbi:MAG TPA: heavy metal translocating P-type ATPase metal-binding domain-containing protein, partial [Cyclobacteriaceae bacterium]|nr:heavy metal translocating P-type ATPase metal-binding domain-containing protein [Cyclobacteriaceae bacterium]
MANGASVRDILAKGLACYHCGDECRKDHIQFDGKDFCCNGCKTVYEILGQNGLYTYYDLEKNPGVAVNEKISAERFSFLENEEIQKNLLLFRDDHISKVSFHIPSIHCSSCIWLLENLSRLGPGIISSRVNFNRKEVQIVFHHTEISLRETAVLLSSIGYEPYISLEQGSRDRYSAVNRDLLVKIGIAGFSFGNTMLLSFPEYFGFEGIQDIFLQRTITWLSAILSVPVIFYCALDYFKSALAGIRQRFINIDIPVSLGIISLFAVSFYQVISGSGPGYFDSLSGLVFFLLIGKWVQNLTYEGLSFDRDYRSYFPMAA